MNDIIRVYRFDIGTQYTYIYIKGAGGPSGAADACLQIVNISRVGLTSYFRR